MNGEILVSPLNDGRRFTLSSLSSLIFSFGEGFPSNSLVIAAALSRIIFSISTATSGFF